MKIFFQICVSDFFYAIFMQYLCNIHNNINNKCIILSVYESLCNLIFALKYFA